MQSNGGLTDAASFRGKDAILSGPAGGIVGMARTAGAAGFDRVIGFDMGGTSTDVSHYAGEFERQYETQVAGVRMRAPMLSIHTVAAGGGSILHFDGGRYQVGPDSAGADPGPACYGHGGPLTVTDANVLLGRIQPAHFPERLRRQRGRAAGPGGDQPPVRRARRRHHGRDRRRARAEQVAAGFLEIATANMANAIKKISVQRGYDITKYVLSTFGGAGGQHACAVADALGMTSVLIHPLAGVLSAYGIGLADVIAMREQAVEAPLDAGLAGRLPGQRARPARGVGPRGADRAAESDPATVRVTRRAHLRYDGTDTALAVPFGPPAEMTAAFEPAYQRQFSFLMRDKPIVVEAISVEAASTPVPVPAPRPRQLTPAPPGPAAGRSRRGRGTRADVHRGPVGAGPAVPRDSAARRAGRGRAGDHRRGPGDDRGRAGLAGGGDRPARPAAHPGARRALAAGAGRHARRIRSCWRSSATCSCPSPSRWACGCSRPRTRSTSRSGWTSPARSSTPTGGLIANAPHIPVHLGSMGESIKMVMEPQQGPDEAG